MLFRSPLHIADHGECEAAVLGQRHGYGAAQARPGSDARRGTGRAGGIVGDGNSSALQLHRADAGVIVGQNRGNRLGPGVAVVQGLAAVDIVRRAASHEGCQVTRLQLLFLKLQSYPYHPIVW